MTTVAIIFGVFVTLSLLSSFLVISASVLSSRISRSEERYQEVVGYFGEKES